MLITICLFAALACFGLATVDVKSKVNLIALGLFLYVLANLLPGVALRG